jgi:hypothetical protein
MECVYVERELTLQRQIVVPGPRLLGDGRVAAKIEFNTGVNAIRSTCKDVLPIIW